MWNMTSMSEIRLYEKKIYVNWILGKDQLADVLTKTLDKKAHSLAELIVQGYKVPFLN